MKLTTLKGALVIIKQTRHEDKGGFGNYKADGA